MKHKCDFFNIYKFCLFFLIDTFISLNCFICTCSTVSRARRRYVLLMMMTRPTLISRTEIILFTTIVYTTNLYSLLLVYIYKCAQVRPSFLNLCGSCQIQNILAFYSLQYTCIALVFVTCKVGEIVLKDDLPNKKRLQQT